MTEKLLIALPHGYCAGVQRAVLTVETYLEKYGAPIYVNHEIVHNKFLVNYFQDKGVVFEDDLGKIPENSIMILSAHGVSPQYREECVKRNLRVIDSTCPLVQKVHNEAKRFDDGNYKILIIGSSNHQEIKGTSSVADMKIIGGDYDIESIDPEEYKNSKVACLTQTTLTTDYTNEIIGKLKVKIPHLETVGNICYSSQNRQDAIRAITKECDFIVVVGSANSSNSNKLVQVAISHGVDSKLFDNAEEIPDEIFKNKTIGLSAGASAPEILVDEVIKKFKSKNPNIKIEIVKSTEENVNFPIPDFL